MPESEAEVGLPLIRPFGTRSPSRGAGGSSRTTAPARSTDLAGTRSERCWKRSEVNRFLLPLREKVGGGAARMRGKCPFAGCLKASLRLAYPSSGPPGHLLPQGEKAFSAALQPQL